jgi:hypothetical protein
MYTIRFTQKTFIYVPIREIYKNTRKYIKILEKKARSYIFIIGRLSKCHLSNIF